VLVEAKDISKSFGPKEVLRSVDLTIDDRDRIGLVGPNGAGKSTLLKILTGELRPDLGDLDMRTDRMQYLPQFHQFGNGTLEDVFEDAFTSGTQARLRELEGQMIAAAEHPDIDLSEVASEYSRLQEELTACRGLDVESKKHEALERVGMAGRPRDNKITELSGGETTRVMLAKVLMLAEEADLLILDEPTSHLDIETVESLEDYLLTFPGAVLVVSHDRYFLDRVVTQIWDLDDGILQKYRGSYTDFVPKKMLEVAKRRIAYHKNQVERERLLKIAEEQHLRLKFASTHKTRLKMVERMEEVEEPPEQRNIRIKMQAAPKSGKNVLTAKSLSVKRGARKVLDGIDLELVVGDKMGIFGPNGSGKTTLLMTLIEELDCEGDLWIAPGAKIGYFAQGHDGLDVSMTPEQQLMQALGEDGRNRARSLLAQMLFTDEQVQMPISNLSGGERAKVALAILTSEQRNLLLLDEPTNYLDLQSREGVEMALSDYKGTMLLVTHDRYLLDSVCNKVGELRNGRLRVFNGTYSQMKGMISPVEIVAEGDVYKVVSGFTDWTNRKKYKAGDKLAIAPQEKESFKWALDAGKLKKVPGKEFKKVKRSN